MVGKERVNRFGGGGEGFAKKQNKYMGKDAAY